jgi:hypothetical protein
MWIWIGVYIVVFGTGVALVPSRAAVALSVPARTQAAVAPAGD